MSESISIPQSYDQWRQLITGPCGIPLTQSFVETRLEDLRDSTRPHTQQFREKYGQEYLEQVIGWFETALRDAK